MILKAYYHPSWLIKPTFLASVNLDDKKDKMNREEFNDYVHYMANQLYFKYSHKRKVQVFLVAKSNFK